MAYDPHVSEADYRNADGDEVPAEKEVDECLAEIAGFCEHVSRMTDAALDYRRMVWGQSVANEDVDAVFDDLAERFWSGVAEPYKRVTRDTTLEAPKVAYVPFRQRRPVPTNPASYPAGDL